MNKVSPIFFHGNPGEGMEQRFDTTMMVNGSIAVLCAIAKTLGLRPAAVDEAYLGSSATALDVLSQLVEERLHTNLEPLILATTLSYNAATTLPLLHQLKSRYGSKIRVGVGGQLIRTCPEAYLKKPFLDHVAVGDAEATLPNLFAGDRFASGYVAESSGRYADPDYDNYWALSERLAEMSTYRLGPFTNIRQLVVESVRGCAWAYAAQTCDMCSLEGIDLEPRFRSLPQHLTLERRLKERWGATWMFDVSNQWLPMLDHNKMADWLESYCARREAWLGKDGGLNKYVYLTANSITARSAPLLKKAGVRIAYIGFDGWDKTTLRALHKSQPSIRRVLELCQDNDLHVRTSLVIGNGVTNKNLAELPGFVRDTIAEFGTIIRSWGNFIQIVLPGSPVFTRFRQQAAERGWSEVSDLYRQFAENGYFTWEEQSQLNELFIRLTQPVDYDQLVTAHDEAERIVNQSSTTSGVTIEHGGVMK